MVSEVSAAEYTAGVEESFSSSIVVVRGLATEAERRRLTDVMPERGKRRLYLRPHMMFRLHNSVDTIRHTRGDVGRVVATYLSRQASARGFYLQRPDTIRRGDVPMHVDDRTIVVSTSVNVDDGSSPTTLCAERIEEADAPYARIQKAAIRLLDYGVENLGARVVLEPGDAAIIGRGVLHCNTTDPDRTSIVFRTRGFV